MRTLIRFWEWLTGRHVCQEFTQWTVKEQACVRNASQTEFIRGIQEVEFTETWQERRCTLCGKVYQENLEYYASDDEDH